MSRFAVLVFPGSNCDHDAYYVLRHLPDCQVEFVWHKDHDLARFDAVIIPGGFSYGDYLRAGSIAKFSPIMQSVVETGKKGIPVIGICNGFQILVESGLLPGALIANQKLKFLSQNVTLKVESNSSIFTRNLEKGDLLTMPIAHKQGNYYADADTLKELQDQDRIAFTYADEGGGNPNGSVLDIAGVLNADRNILGMMPHPERAAEDLLNSSDGLAIFESIVGQL